MLKNKRHVFPCAAVIVVIIKFINNEGYCSNSSNWSNEVLEIRIYQ